MCMGRSEEIGVRGGSRASRLAAARGYGYPHSREWAPGERTRWKQLSEKETVRSLS